MSPKELLGHEKQIKCTCKDSAQKLENKELANFVEGLATRHTQCFNKFYNLVGGNYAG